LARPFSNTSEVAEQGTSENLLTSRELEVLYAVARGERSKEIALHLGITERTVKAHLARIITNWG